MYLNKTTILGNLTRDPELKSLPSGQKVANLSVATNRVWKDQAGAKQEAVEYHDIIVFGRQAETSAEYLKKGQQVLVEGRLQTRSWDDTEGKKKYKTEIVAESIQFGAKTNPSGALTGSDAESVKAQHDNAKARMDQANAELGEVNPDDIPF